MGRIAEALKKAERERREKVVTPAREPAVALRTTSPPAEPAPPPPQPRPVRNVSEGMSESLVAYYDSSSLITEQYRSLRTRLLSMNPDNEHRVLAITSAVPKEGKSVSALNTALILAEVPHLRIAVVDADFRRGSLCKLLNQDAAPGLADVVQGRVSLEEALQPTTMPNLFFLPAGKTDGHGAAQLLASEAMPDIFRTLRERYHYTLVDTPPATTVTDVGIIGQMCTGVIMVIRMNRTPDPVTRRAVRLLQVNNIPLVGCLLVGHSERNSRYGYYYGYYPHYRYYDYDKHKTDKDEP